MMHTKDEIFAAKKDDAIKMIRENLLESPKWLCRGIAAIYRLQTVDEQIQQTTKENNGVGFNGVDANILSSFAMQIDAFDPSKYKFPLSPKQMEIAKKKMVKYSKQLYEISRP